MMIRCIFILLCLMMLGCSKYLMLGLINNSGVPIFIFLGEDKILLDQGKFMKTKYSKVVSGRKLTISVGVCSYIYIFPEKLKNYFHHLDFDGEVTAQLETDLGLYLVEPGKREPTDIQRPLINEVGFPLSPSSGGCDSHGQKQVSEINRVKVNDIRV